MEEELSILDVWLDTWTLTVIKLRPADSPTLLLLYTWIHTCSSMTTYTGKMEEMLLNLFEKFLNSYVVEHVEIT